MSLTSISPQRAHGIASRKPRRRVFTRVLVAARELGQKRYRVLVFGLLGFFGAMTAAQLRGLPLPYIHDEFAYLLTAETFAHGRLTNPTHAMWHHFESFHIIHDPSYQSKYPPGQALLLAAGISVLGDAAWGLWLGAGLLAAAVAWCLYILLPPAWAGVAALFWTIHVVWTSYWSQSYWGGSLAATGGALGPEHYEPIAPLTGAVPARGAERRTHEKAPAGRDCIPSGRRTRSGRTASAFPGCRAG